MNKSLVALSMGAVVLGSMFAFANTAQAYRGDPTVTGPNYSQERHAEMEKAFETGDYTAWKTLMQGRGRVTQVVNESNFARFAEAHELAEQGKLEEAAKIRQELGLGMQNGSGRGTGTCRWSK